MVVRLCCLAATLLFGVSSRVLGGDLFSVGAQTTSGAPQTVKASGSNLPDLVTNLVNSEKQFAQLSGRDVSATFNYAGINKAITITKNAANTSATVNIPSIGLTKTFTASNSNDLKNQIIHYARQNGASDYGRFLRVVNQSSTAGVTDGNPLAATAMLADHQYFTFGLQRAPWPAEQAGGLNAAATPNIRFDLRGGVEHSAIGNGDFASGALDVGFKFGNRVGLVFSTPLLYRNLQGSHTYEVGEEVALPINIILPKGQGLSWSLTPAGMVGAAGSLELAAGGTFAGGGITSSLNYQLGSFTFTLADQ